MWPVIVVLGASVGAAVLGLMFGGGAVAPLVVDPGVAVRWGLPIAMVILRISSSLTLGSLLLAAFALGKKNPSYERALLIAGWSAAVWTVSSVAAGALTFQAVYLEPVSFDDRFGSLLALFFSQTEIGLAWLWSSVFAAATTVVAMAVRGYGPVVLAGVLAVAGMWPLAELGHSAGAASHNQAITSAFLHYVFLGFWVGGLITLSILVWSKAMGSAETSQVVGRYSTIALVSSIVVASSGVLNAAIRIGSPEALATPYGALVVAKTVILVALIAFGASYRIRILHSDRVLGYTTNGLLARVFLLELGVMGMAMGLAVALARTETPVPDIPASQLTSPSPAEYLTGQPLPPEFDWTKTFTVWELDLLWALIAVFGAFYYLAGVRRLKQRGDSWPIHRTVSWVAGMSLLLFTTSSGLYVYGTYLFSVHMVAHMILSMAIPLLLVLGTPVTLAARAIAARADGSRGPREWILTIVNSRYLAIIGHPLIAVPVFALSLIVFYYSPLFAWALEDHLGHVWMTAHFLLSGYLFSLVLLDADPHPHRPAYPLRIVTIFATMAFHAFFGLALIMGQSLLVPEWYGAMGRQWGLPPLEDQQQGGELAWGLGEIPTVVLAILVTWAWSRGDAREQRRLDRQADRDDDRELRAYNEMLAKRAEVEQNRTR